jgi:hypothetical protein
LIATGGGAVALTGIGYRGGSIEGTGQNSDLGTGGAGIGGEGSTKYGTGYSYIGGGTGGGGACHQGESLYSQYQNMAEGSFGDSNVHLSGLTKFGSLTGFNAAIGGTGGSNEHGGNGGNSSSGNNHSTSINSSATHTQSLGAGGGGSKTTNNRMQTAGDGGAFGGGGGHVGRTNDAGYWHTGNGGVGGGGGGTARHYTGQNFRGSRGGQGIVFIHYTAFA